MEDRAAAERLAPVAALLWALAGTVIAAIALVLLAAPLRFSIGTLVGDDAGYYFAIARNMVLGHGFSFDRIHPTNGFNPLFPWLLIPLDHLLPRGLPLAACYRLGAMVGWLAVALAGIAFVRLAHARLERAGWPRDTRRLALAACAAFFALFIATKGYYGMDAPLVLLLGLVYLARVDRAGLLAPGAAAAVIDGALLALLFLARVDTVPLIGAAAAVMALEARARGGWARLAARLVLAGVLVAPYLIWSTARFGTWMPVSARLKSGFPHVDLATSLWTIRHTSLAPPDQLSFLLAFVLAIGVIVRSAPAVVGTLRARAPLAAGEAALLVFALYLAGRLGFMLLFSRADVQGSYAILAHAFNVLVAIAAVGAVARRGGAAARPLALGVSLAFALVALGLFAGKLRTSLTRLDAVRAHALVDEASFGAELNAHTRPGDVLFGGSFGLLGFFTDRPWINGDGVVNTYEYQRMFRAPEAGGGGPDALADYFRANRVTHVVFELPRGAALPVPLRFTAHGLLAERARSVALDPADLVLRRPMSRGRVDVLLVRWRSPEAVR